MDAYEAAQLKARNMVRSTQESTGEELARFRAQMSEANAVTSSTFTTGQISMVFKAAEALSQQLPELYAATIGREINKERATSMIITHLQDFARGLLSGNAAPNMEQFQKSIRDNLDVAVFELGKQVDESRGQHMGTPGGVSYRATVVNVMIASPGDVEEKRQIIRDVIAVWNAIHAEDKKFVLMPMGWESHASPTMGVRAQEVINKQVLERCGLLVAVFWTRLGSPTGESPSGTVEEINKHIEAGRPAMIYFSNAPVRPDSVDDVQYKALVTFREECEQRGLIERYDSVEEFRDKFTRQLAQNVLREFIGQLPSAEIPEPGAVAGFLSLTDEAKQLLVEASKDSNGTVLVARTMQGTIIKTNNKGLGETGNPRSEAIWQAAVQELVERGLLDERGHKGEVFAVTRKGYDVADSLNQK